MELVVLTLKLVSLSLNFQQQKTQGVATEILIEEVTIYHPTVFFPSSAHREKTLKEKVRVSINADLMKPQKKASAR